MKPARVDHIGIIVDELDPAIERFSALLGVEPTRRDLPETGLEIAVFRAANIRIELLAYSGEADFARKVMGAESGLNHIAVGVDDLEAETSRLSGEGFSPQDGFPRQGAHSEVVFFERDEETGLLFELCGPEPHGEPEGGR